MFAVSSLGEGGRFIYKRNGEYAAVTREEMLENDSLADRAALVRVTDL